MEDPGKKLAYQDEDEDLSPARDVMMYQTLTANAKYFTQGRSDILFAVKEPARSMPASAQGSLTSLIQLRKYLTD